MGPMGRGQVRSGQVRFITRPKSRTMRATRQLMLPPNIVSGQWAERALKYVYLPYASPKTITEVAPGALFAFFFESIFTD
jgi:hypothetical protein